MTTKLLLSRSAGGMAAALLAMIASMPALAQPIAITGATLAIGDGSEPVRGGTVVIDAGKVVAAGAGIAVPAGAKVIDAAGKWVTPGLVSGFSRVGLAEVPAVTETNDISANSPFSAAIDVAPAINPLANPIAISRTGGVTRAVVAPAAASGIFGGQGAVIDLGADMSPITKARAFEYVEMGEAGAAEAGGSRAAMILTFRMMLRQAQDYAKAPASFDGNSKDALLNRVDAEALVPVVTGAMPLMVHVESARDILTVLSLRQEFPALRLILAGATEGWMVAPQIAAAKVPVITAGLEDLPSAFEKLAATQSNVGRMVKAGVSVSMGMLTGDAAIAGCDPAGRQYGGADECAGRDRAELGAGAAHHHPGACRGDGPGRSPGFAPARQGGRRGDLGRRSAGNDIRPRCGLDRWRRTAHDRSPDAPARPLCDAQRRQPAQGL